MTTLFDINTSANISTQIDTFVNFGNDTFFKAFVPFTNVLGSQIFWTAIFLVIGLALAVQSKYQMTLLLAYFLAVNIFVAILLMPLAFIIFGVINALLGTIIVYRGFVSKR